MDRFAYRPGAVLASRYRLDREVGRGGTATVFLAEDLRHGRAVALKALHPELAGSLGADRFLREIEIASRLAHPHILGLLDSGEADGLLYYVMPYVSGDSLRARLRREGELPVGDAVRIFREVLDALAYAHAQGVVHRDIKPENILLVGAHVQVADFGVAKAVQTAGGGPPLTVTGMAVGTPAYMAPEQATGDPGVDHRADIYAAGLVAYEMLTGSPPFGAGRPDQLLAAHLTRPVEPLQHLRPSVPPPLAALVMRCLEKRPGDRWQSAEEVRHQLELLLTGAGNVAAIVGLGRELTAGSFRLTEEICARLDRHSFDPRFIGDTMQYLDNRTPSDVLVCYVHGVGSDAEEAVPFLRDTRYRAVAPTFVGFEPSRQRRFGLPLEDHAVLITALLEALVAEVRPRYVVLVGFSLGADFVMRLAAAPDPDPRVPLHGAVALGGNLALETCFVTRILAKLPGGSEDDLLAALRAIGGSAAGSLDEWLNLHAYFVRVARKFRGTLEPVTTVAADVIRPFETAPPLEPFVTWYRDATRHGRQLRCVFEDSPLYRQLVRDLQLRHRDDRVLGDHYQPDSIVIDPETGHFDLMEPARVERHVTAVLERIRAEPRVHLRT